MNFYYENAGCEGGIKTALSRRNEETRGETFFDKFKYVFICFLCKHASTEISNYIFSVTESKSYPPQRP